MQYTEKATILFLINTIFSLVLLAIRIKYDYVAIISNEDTISISNRQSMYLMESIYHILRIIATFRVIWHRKLAYCFAVDYLNFDFIVLYTSKILVYNMFTFYQVLELVLHLVYSIYFYIVSKKIKRENLIQFLRVVSCDVQRIRIFFIRKNLQPQRYILYSIILLRNISLYVFCNRLDNLIFLIGVFVDYWLNKFERYEIRLTKYITIGLWIANLTYTIYLISYREGQHEEEYLFEVRVALYIGIVCIHIVYNIMDLYFYGNGINNLPL